MFDYVTLPKLTKQYDAKAWPAPTKVFSTINKAQTAFFNKQMKNKNSVVYKAVLAGRKAHNALETGNAKSLMEERVLELFDREIGCDIDETWAKEMGLISTKHRFKGKFDGVGIFQGKVTMWDYKKTNKLKTPSQMKNYLKQCAAYALAHDEMYGTKIQQIAIMNIGGKTVDDLTAKVSVFEPSEYKEGFLTDLSTYYSMENV